METVFEPTREDVLKKIRQRRVEECRARLGRLLLIYFAVIVVLVLSGGGNFIAREGSFSGRIVYACLPFFMWLYSQRSASPGDFVSIYALVEGVQAALLLLLMVLAAPFLADSPLHGPGLILLVLIASLVGACLGLALLVSIFKEARKLVGLLRVQEKDEGEVSGDPWFVPVGIIFLMLLCYAAPRMDFSWSRIVGVFDRYTASVVKVYDVGSRIEYMAGSPDGNLLALGTEKGLYVWDTTSRECVWSDDCLAVQRIRFWTIVKKTDREREGIKV